MTNPQIESYESSDSYSPTDGCQQSTLWQAIDFDQLVHSVKLEVRRVEEAGRSFLPELSLLDGDTAADAAATEQPFRSWEEGPSGPADSTLRSDDVKHLFEQNFNHLDTDGNGVVSEWEIDVSFESPYFQGADSQLLAVLKQNQDQLEELSNDQLGDECAGITINDIEKFDQLVRDGDQGSKELINSVDYVLYRSGESLDGASHELFADSADPLASIKPEAVEQGLLGDCYFLSAVASLAATDPEAIRDMIKENANGTYTVTFPGDPDNPVTITAPTEAELALFAGGSEHGTWPAVLEKAYGAYFGLTTVPADFVGWGGLASSGINILSPGGANLDLLSRSETADIDSALQEALSNGRPVTIGTHTNVMPGESLVGEAGIPEGHNYSVIGYDPETQTVTIRNPWGHGEPTNPDGTAKDGVDDGIFTMTVAEVQKNFTTIGYGL